MYDILDVIGIAAIEIASHGYSDANKPIQGTATYKVVQEELRRHPEDRTALTDGFVRKAELILKFFHGLDCKKFQDNAYILQLVGYASRYFQGHVKVGIVDVPVVVSMVGTHIKMIAGIEKNYPAYPGSDLHGCHGYEWESRLDSHCQDDVLASDRISMQVTKEVFAKSQYIGELGKVGRWFFKLYEVLDKDNYTIWVVIDRRGNRGFWYNSPVALNGAQVPKVGDCFTVTAKVVVQKTNTESGVKGTRFVSVNIVAPNKSLTNVSSTSTDEQMITTTICSAVPK